eukprot:2694470-Rhodomonas_salina.2
MSGTDAARGTQSGGRVPAGSGRACGATSCRGADTGTAGSGSTPPLVPRFCYKSKWMIGNRIPEGGAASRRRRYLGRGRSHIRRASWLRSDGTKRCYGEGARRG